MEAYEIRYVLVCPNRTFRILHRLKIIKYVQHTLAGARHVHEWTHKAKMAGLFVLFTCSTEPLVAFVRVSGYQSAKRSATRSKLSCALPFSLFFLFVVMKHVWLLKCLLQKSHGILGPAFLQAGRTIITTCLFASVYHAVFTDFVTTLTSVSFRHSPCQVAYDMIVTCYFVK